MKIFEKIYTEENTIIDLVEKLPDANSPLLISYINQNCFNIYVKDKAYRHLIDNHFTIFSDGIGIYLLLKFLGRENIQKFNATDLNHRILDSLTKKGKNLYFIGGRFSKQQINEFINKTKINFAGYSDGYFKTEQLPEIAKSINDSNSDVIIIGMGVPKQENIAYELSKKVKSKLIICVGYFLEFTIGGKKRITPKLRDSGYEWLFRLVLEPTRLWKRYLVGIPVFFVNMIRVKFKN